MEPRWFKAWFVVCALLTVWLIAFGVWVVISLVNYVTG